MTMREILAQVAAERRVSITEMVSQTKRRTVAHARQEAMFRLMSVERDGRRRFAVTRIGKLLHRDHSSVVTGAQAHARRHGLAYPRLRRAP